MSSTEAYTSGRFDAALIRALEKFDEIQAIMLPSLREERAATYSPFLPIHPATGVVMQAPVIGHDAKAGTIRWRDPDTNEEFETPVTGGRCKLQWKPDWAMRWHALGVDYEMAGKDLIDSVKLSSRIARALGAEPPAGFNYELFLDENGQKISKSKGNGLTIEEWLTYASPESLSLFMFQKPTRGEAALFRRDPADGRRLSRLPRGLSAARSGRSGSAIRSGTSIPARRRRRRRSPTATRQTTVSFAMLLNLAAVANSDNPAVLWGFLRRYAPSASPENHPRLDRLVRLRGRLLPRFRRAEEALPRRPTRSSARRCCESPPSSRKCRRARRAEDDPARPLRYRPADSALPGSSGQERDA